MRDAHNLRRSPYAPGRMTAQRRAIAEAARGLRRAFTVEELHAAALARFPGLGMATVYRATTALAAVGTLTQVGERDGGALYAFCDRGDHHHHLVCTGCGRIAGMECPLDTTALAAADSAGFTVTGHEITVYGLCHSCEKGA